MLIDPNAEGASLREHVDIFVNNFFVNGARNHLRKTTRHAPWLNVGVMERTNPELIYNSGVFRGMNVVGGGGYSLGHGFVHGYLQGMAESHLHRAVRNLNALGADEIVFYHDENLRGLETARDMGLRLDFTPVSLLEWLVRLAGEHPASKSALDIPVAVQLPCSWRGTLADDRLLKTLFGLIGCSRVERKYDRDGRVCCGARAYLGLETGDVRTDTGRADARMQMNVLDAKEAGARYFVTLCPYCFAASAGPAREAGLVPVQLESLVNLALFGEMPPDGLLFM